MEQQLNSYELSRKWFNYSFDNPEKVKPIHSAIYFFAIEHCNRLGWKQKFGFPSQMVMEAVGVKNWRTYSKALNDLVDFGFIDMIEISKNQYSSNIIAIVKNTKAPTKALDKALQSHSTKQGQSTVSIDKQLTTNKEPLTQEQFLELFNSIRISKGLPSNIKRLGYEEMANLKLLESYNLDEFTKSINNCLDNKWVIENNQGFPKHILKLENFTKYLNMEIQGRKPISEMTTHEKLKLR